MALAPGDKAVRVKLSDGFGAYPCSPVLDVGNRAVRARVSGGLTAVKASLVNVVGGYRVPCRVSDTEMRAAVNLRWMSGWSKVPLSGLDGGWFGLKAPAVIGERIYYSRFTGRNRCFIEPATKTWGYLSDMPGWYRHGIATGVINGVIYAGLGEDGSTPDEDRGQWFANETDGDTWTPKAPLRPYGSYYRHYSTSVSINGLIYVGMGRDDRQYNTTVYDDWWAYDPDSDSWAYAGKFGGGPRYGAVGVVLGGRVFVGLGASDVSWTSTTFHTDWWEWIPGGAWTQRADFPGKGRVFASAVACGGYIYVGMGNGGYMSSSPLYDDWWRYDRLTNSWASKEDFIGGAVQAGAVAAIRNRVYYATMGDSNNLSYLYRYDPAGVPWGIE